MNYYKLIAGNFDWMATRLTPRQYFPPASNPQDPLVSKPYQPSSWHPGMINIPGVEGIGIEKGMFGKTNALLVRLAVPHPFRNDVMVFAKRRAARWNSIFNTWDIPVLSQRKNILSEIWDRLEECFFEIPWHNNNIEIHWRLSINESNLLRLSGRIEGLNEYWKLSYPYSKPDLIIEGLSRDSIVDSAIQDLKKRSLNWVPESEYAINRMAVNYIRHSMSAYHVLLEAQKPYLESFKIINTAIAQAYPWAADEAMDQIHRKHGNSQ